MGSMYYGWIIVGISAAAMVGTLPGRTQGLGLITEPLLADLGLGRVQYAQLNLWATLIGSLFAIGIGRFIDRFGARVVLTAIGLALGGVVAIMSGVQSFWPLAITVTLTRGLGQSALSVVSIAMVGHWFVRRIDMAMATYSIVLSIGFMIAFPVVGSLVQSRGWRFAWMSIAVGLIAVLAPAAWLMVRSPSGGDRPFSSAEVSAKAEGLSSADNIRDGATWQEAIATPAFWIFSVGAALYGLVASGIGLFNESILAERGFGPNVYYQTLVVTAMTALIGNFGGGWLAMRMSLTNLLSVSLVVLALGLGALPHVTTVVQVMLWAIAMGLGGGLVMVLFFSVWPRLYGRKHLGRIQGAAQAMTVVASAVGPLMLAWCLELTGSYTGMFTILAGVIGLTAVAAVITPLPAAAAGAVAPT